MPAPEEFNVLPGMTATVSVDFSGFLGAQQVFLLPASAVIADNAMQAKVWVVDENSLTVSSRQVEVGRMRGGEIEVLKGLEHGDRVIVAGVPFMVEGMKVWLLPDKEEAEQREGDRPPQAAPQS